MIARTSWSAKADQESADQTSEAAGSAGRSLDGLLDARFDSDGRLSAATGGEAADRIDPRPPALSAEELERAVQKLARGLEAIERQGPAPQAGPANDVAGGQGTGERGRDFITYSLDRLEARLEALTKRLQQRAAAPAETAAQPRPAPAAARRPQPPQPPRPPEATVAARPTAPRQAAEADPRRVAPSLAVEAGDKAAVAKRQAEQAEARKRAAEAEVRRRTELTQARRAAEAAEAESKASTAATVELKRQFAALETRIEAMQQNLDSNQIEPVRAELFELLRNMQAIGRDGRSVGDAVAQVRARLEDIDTKLNAGRELTGERLTDLQDRLSGLTERLGDVETEVPGFDALRENQTAILERFDRMEGVVQHLFSPDELFERIDGLRRQLQTSATQQEASRIEAQILALADRLEALPEALGDKAVLQRVEAHMQALAEDFAEARRQRKAGAADLDARLADLSASVRDLGAVDRAPDLSGVENRLDTISSRLDGDRRSSGDALGGIDRRLAELAAAIEAQEDEASAEILAGLSRRMDGLADAIEGQDVRGARRDIEGLGRKFDELSRTLAEQRESLSPAQASPVDGRLAELQSQLADFARRAEASNAQFGPFAQKLHEISERLSGAPAMRGDGPLLARLAAIEERLAGLAPKGPDNRALHNQLESIVSRLELLKGRSIDPARLNELFDRVDAAMRSGGFDERFDRLERKIAESAAPRLAEAQIERLERRIAQAGGGVSDDRLVRLEDKLDQVFGASLAGAEPLSNDELADLRGDIGALRRELRSLPGLGEGEANLGAVLKTISERLERLPEHPPATTAELEAQIDRVAQLLEDPTHSRLALAHIESSLKSIEKRLEEARRGLMAQPGAAAVEHGEIRTVAGLARSLSDDVTVLRSSAEASEKKTKDALDAVQDTLEAVVKRMAFLERDGEAAAAARDDGGAPSTLAALPAAEQEPPAVAAVEMPPKPEATRESAPGRLFSRFTSSQLLKRATGGRAESFSPDADENDDAADLPLEPGTDSPLTSALTGAPSSDTALLSGARAKTRRGGLLANAEPGRQIDLGDEADGDDFLAAARRAARAATAEAVEAEERPHAVRVSRFFGSMRPRRRMALAAAVAVAVAIVALQFIRRDAAPEEAEVVAIAPGQTIGEGSAEPGGVMAPADSPPAAAGEADTVEDDLLAGPNDDPTTIVAEPDMAALDPGTMASSPAGPADGAPRATAAMPAGPAAALPPAIGPERLKSAAEAGDPAASFEVASRYAEGRDAEQDIDAAIGWYERAAQAGLAPAQYRLGSIYEKGTGVPKDLVAAQDWYGRAAEAGNVKAMHNLAVLYAEGAGGEPDLEGAAALFRQAAEHGVRDSQFNLAILHARGLGVKQDMIEAYKWFAIAAGSGDAESLKRRDIIAGTLNEADLAKAQSEAAAFEPLPIIAEANDVMMPEDGWGESATSVDMEPEDQLVAATGSIPEGSAISENDLVAMVQALLAEKGYDPGPADGLLGRNTIQAITRFQEEAGLPKTGQIDPKLLSALNGST